MSGDDGLSYCCVKREPSSEEDDPDTSYAQSFYSKSVETLGPLETLAPAAPAAVPVSGSAEPRAAATFATLEAAPARQQTSSSLLERHRSLSVASCGSQEEYMFAIKDEPVSDEHPGSDDPGPPSPTGDRKSWTAQDMDQALQALKSRAMSLTKASATYGIPSTSLWQRAHRLGIDTPKKEGNTKSWGDADLRRALHALRTGAISANKASKAYGIPSSTLYKIARREGIRLAAPFNAAPTSWQRDELRQALEAIRCGAASVQCAAVQFGIPTGTLYGRCKREGIELSRSNPTPWSEHAMGEALESVRVGQMSINQAAIHYNLPYSSLYGRFKRIKQVNQPQDYAESQPPESGANQPSHTHPEIAFLNQSIQESPQRDQLHPPALQLHTDQGLGSPAQSSQRLDEGLNPPTYVLVGQGLQPIDEGLRSPTYHLSGQGFSPQGLHRVEAGLTSPTHALDRGLTPQGLLNDQVLNSPVPSRSSPMLNLTQLHASPNQRSQSAIKLEASPDQVEPGLRSPMQVNQTLQSPVQEQDHKTMNLLTPGPGDANQVSLQPNLDPQSLNSPVPSFPASPPINPGLNPPAPYQGLQTLHPYLFSQYSDQYPTEYSLYYQSCNGLAS